MVIVSNFQQMLQKVNSRAQHKINKFCDPLMRHFGVNHFWYQQLTNSGHYSVLGNNLDWMEYFFAEGLHYAIPHFRHPSMLPSGTSLIRRIKDKSLEKMIDTAVDKFNIHFSLMLMNKTSKGIEAFGFALNSADELQHAQLLGKLPLLRLFAEQFRQQHRSLFEVLEDNKADMAKAMGSLFYENPTGVITPSIPLQAFLQEIGLKNIAVSFTSREVEVIRYLLDGYSPSYIGDFLYLSKRTVEHYIENIKDKLQSYSKADLVQKLRALESVGYFIP